MTFLSIDLILSNAVLILSFFVGKFLCQPVNDINGFSRKFVVFDFSDSIAH